METGISSKKKEKESLANNFEVFSENVSPSMLFKPIIKKQKLEDTLKAFDD